VLDATDRRTRGRWAALDTAAGGLALDLALYGLSAIFALLTALTATLPPHRPWGWIAFAGYLAATLFVAGQWLARRPARTLTTLLTWATVALLPLVVEAVQRAGGRTGRAQEEVVVVERAGARLLHTGTPYLSHEALAALPPDERLLGYVPYQPGMALFGLPRAVFGVAWWTDARVWFALATAAALALAARQLLPGPALLRAVQAATVLPVCALTLAVGGDDLPVLALCLLALAYAARRRYGAAGIAVGLAGALKLFAWPVALVLLVVARRHRGYALAALGIPLLVLLPAALVDRDATVENVFRFPLGHGLLRSPAGSPFPGHLVATMAPAGSAIAAVLLLGAGLALGVWLLRRPPADAVQAARVCAVGMLAAILLMPTTRFGYLLYPVAYAVWAAALTARPSGPTLEA
jgi:glycosyl transferase family 87